MLVQLQDAYAGWVLTQINTALLCTFYWQLELSICPLLADISHPHFCFQSRGFGHSCLPCPLIAGLKKRACSHKIAGLQVSPKHSHFWKQRPGCLALRFLYCILHKSVQDCSDTVSLGWVCVQDLRALLLLQGAIKCSCFHFFHLSTSEPMH